MPQVPQPQAPQPTDMPDAPDAPDAPHGERGCDGSPLCACGAKVPMTQPGLAGFWVDVPPATPQSISAGVHDMSGHLDRLQRPPRFMPTPLIV